EVVAAEGRLVGHGRDHRPLVVDAITVDVLAAALQVQHVVAAERDHGAGPARSAARRAVGAVAGGLPTVAPRADAGHVGARLRAAAVVADVARGVETGRERVEGLPAAEIFRARLARLATRNAVGLVVRAPLLPCAERFAAERVIRGAAGREHPN